MKNKNGSQKMDKHKLFQQIESSIKEQIADAERARQDSQDEANRHVGRMQSRYDTFKEEAQQMAAAHELRKVGLSRSLSTIRSFLADLDTLQTGGMIRIGSVVLLESLDGQKQKRVALAPVGGGIKISQEVNEVTIVTPSAPLGRTLLGKLGGEKIELILDGKTVTYAILEVI
ncbi:MAG TPA: hypothetical protein VJB69_00585 [Candidatus Paceibacterota bacterium]